MKTWQALVLWTLVALLTLTRPFLPVQLELTWFAAYKDFSHLFVGGLFGAAIARKSWSLFWMATVPSLMELIVALIK